MAQRKFEELEDSMEMCEAPSLSSVQTIMSSAASTLQLRPVVATAVEATAALVAPTSPPAFVNPSKVDFGGSILSLSAHSTILSASALKKFQLAFIKCENQLESKWVKGDVQEGKVGKKEKELSAMEELLCAEEEKVLEADAAALQVPSLASLKKRKVFHLKEEVKKEIVEEKKVENEDEEDIENEDELAEDEASTVSRMFAKFNAKRRRVRKDANGNAFIELSMSSVPPLHVLTQMNNDTSEELAAYAFARNLVDFGEQFLKDEKEFKDAQKKNKTVHRKAFKTSSAASISSPTSSVISLESELESLPLTDELPALSVFSEVSSPGSELDEQQSVEGAEEDNVSDGEEVVSTYSDDAETPCLFDGVMGQLPASFPYSPINEENLSELSSLYSSAASTSLLDDSFSFPDFALPAYPQASPKCSPRASPSFSFASIFHPLPSAFNRAPSSGIVTLESFH